MNKKKQFRTIHNMELTFSAIVARAHALVSIGCEIEEDLGPVGSAICQLANDIRRDVEKAEKRRSKVSGALHRLAYPVRP